MHIVRTHLRVAVLGSWTLVAVAGGVMLASPIGLRSRHRRLADVGRDARSQSGLEDDGRCPIEWDVKTKKNVKWVAELGSQSYGNPVVAGGMVFVGTNNELLRDPKQGGDRGVLMAFRESDGEFLWQHTHAKLEAGRANDWPFQGVASSPLVDRRPALLRQQPRRRASASISQGFRDNENDGPVNNETLTGQTDADVVWAFDMIEEVGAYPHNLANSSPVVWGDLIYVSTSNGQDESHVNVPSPRAPAIIAVNKRHGQARLGRQLGGGPHPARPVVHAVRRHDRRRRAGRLRAGRRLGPRLRSRDRQEALGVRHQSEGLGLAAHAQRGHQHARHLRQRVYIANGQDPEHGEGVGHFYAIDATKRGDITTTGRRLALRQDPPVDLDGGRGRRARLHRRLQRLPALPRRQDRPALLDARHVRRRSGARRLSSTTRSTWATRTATSSSCSTAKRRRCSPR